MSGISYREWSIPQVRRALVGKGPSLSVGTGVGSGVATEVGVATAVGVAVTGGMGPVGVGSGVDVTGGIGPVGVGLVGVGSGVAVTAGIGPGLLSQNTASTAIPATISWSIFAKPESVVALRVMLFSPAIK